MGLPPLLFGFISQIVHNPEECYVQEAVRGSKKPPGSTPKFDRRKVQKITQVDLNSLALN